MRRCDAYRLLAALTAVLLAALPGGERASAGDATAPDEWERAYAGFVPGTGDDAEFANWTRVIAADTGQPVPGARLVRWAEFFREGDVERSWPIGTGTADATGLAFVGPSEASGDNHWTASAPGYASACEFGVHPPAVMPLSRGETAVLRLLDPMGSPVEGARVEWFDGCAHAPTLRAARTDARGLARFEDVDPSQGRLWFATPRGTLDPVDARQVFCLGETVPSVVLDPGAALQGVVVDRLGRPARHVLVRSVECGRGPATLSDRDGRFRLPAIPFGSDLRVRPWDLVEERVPSVDDVDFRHPLRITVDPWTVVETPWEGAKVRLHGRVVGGSTLPDAPGGVELLREADGAFQVVAPGGEIVVAPGRYRLTTPSDLEGTFDVEVGYVDVARGAVVDAEVVLHPRPRLRLRGDLPRGAEADLVTPTEVRRPLPEDAEERQVPLSRAVPAALHVRHAGVTFVLPVGPPCDGGREVVVALPPPHRIRWPQGVAPREVRLLRGGHEQAIEESDGGIETRATGDLFLEADLGGDHGTHRLALRLPASGAVDTVVDPRLAPAGPPERVATYRVVAPEGAKVATSVSTSGGYGGLTMDGVIQGSIGARLTATIPGYVPKRVVVTRIEEREIRWGSASLELAVVDEDGRPAPARVLVDDEPFALPEGTLSLAGLDAGPHLLLVAPAGESGPAKELRLVLASGEKRARQVVLGNR